MASIKKAQIKPCVIQFTTITGLDNYTADADLEDYAILLKDITKIYDETIQLYEGHIDKHEGRTFMATFGVPSSHEEDPERSIKSALLLKQKIQAYNKENDLDLSIKIGINLGKVYAGDVGSEIKKEYTVMGDAVNIAARIMECAQNNQILVNEEIHNITDQIFIFGKQKLYTPQGNSNEVKVFEALGPRTGFIRRRGIEGLKSPLVGRTEELNVLKEYLDKGLSGKGNIVVIVGEAGVGKSRLIEELFTHSLSCALERALVVNWCSGYCSPYKETIYLPFIEIIRQISIINNEDSEKIVAEKLLETINRLAQQQAEEIYPYLATLLNLELDEHHQTKVKYLEPKAIKLQTQVAIATLLRNYALEHPCVYVIDDLYLADMQTLEALDFFIQTNADLPALIFLLSRLERDKPFWKIKEIFREQLGVHEIVLRRLTHGQTRQISEHLLRIPKLPAGLVNDIITKSDGNPFFLEEIIKLLIARRILYKQGDEWLAADQDIDFTIPYTIDAIIRTRFDTLSVGLRGLIEEMSVIGRNFSKKLLKAFSNQWEHLDEIVDQLVELGSVSTSDEEEYSFNHALVREVIYSSIPEKRRRGLHLKIAETIEALYRDRLTDYYELLFEHYSQTSERDKMIDYGLKAGEQQAKRYANDEAIFYYLAVLKELPEQSESRLLILKELGRIHSLIGKNEDALEFFNTALQFCPDGPGKAEIYRLIADTYENISDYEQAIVTYNTALKRTVEQSPLLEAQIKSGLARIYYEKGDFNKSLSILEQTETAIAKTSNFETKRVLAGIYNRMGSIYYSIGRKKDSFANYHKALGLYEILEDIIGQSAIFNNLCDYYTDRGDYVKALQSLKKSLEIDVKTGDLLGQAIVIYNSGDTQFQMGNLEGAEESFNKCLNLYQRVNNRLGTGYANTGLGLVAMERDRFDIAQNHFNRALEIFNEVGSKMWQMHVMARIAELNLLTGEYARANQLTDNIILLAENNLDYEAAIYARLVKSRLHITESLAEPKINTMLLQQADIELHKLLDIFSEQGASLDLNFQVYAFLCQVHYHLANMKKAVEYCEKAENFRDEILKYIKKTGMAEEFQNRRVYRDFNIFCKKTKLTD